MSSEVTNFTIDDAILNKSRNDLIFTAQGPAIVVVCLVILAFAFALHGYVQTVVLAVWTLVCILSYAGRYVLCSRYARSSDGDKSLKLWQRRFLVASACSGIIWGSGAFLVFPEGEPSLQLFHILLVIFLAAATTVTHSAYKSASLIFCGTSLVPTAIKLFLIPDAGHNGLSGIVLGFWVVMTTSSFYLEKIANRMFQLTHDNAKLVSDLTHKNTQLEENNQKLEDTKSELSKANDRLQKLVTTDGLTGLTNRRCFEALAKLKWLRCAEAKQPLSLLAINIDNFKEFNDFYGHRKGDSCLISIASYLGQVPEISRTGDALARYGGDEFTVLLVDADEVYARSVAEELRRGIELLRIPCSEMPGGISPWISVSIGYSTGTDFGGQSFDDLLDLTDKALAQAKRAGRNCVLAAQDIKFSESPMQNRD